MSHFRLYTFRVFDGFDTFAATSEQEAFRRAEVYYPRDCLVLEPEAHICHCERKVAKPVREGGWLICDRRQCSGYIGLDK